MMKITTNGIRAALVVLMMTLASSFNPVLADADEAWFQLGDKTYGASDLPEMLQQALHEAELKFHKEKEALVEEALAVMEIDKRAEASGKSGDEIAAELFSAEPPTDEAVAAFYEENKARINQPMDAIKPQIIQLLTQQAQAEKQQAFLTKLKQDGDFKMLLKAPQAPEVKIDISGFPFKGPEDAKVVLVEFADYQCPHCKHAGDALKKVAEQFKDDLKIVFMDYPINRSGISRKIAEGAVCASEQDKFWEYHDLAFSDQRALKKDSAPEFAKQLGLDESAFADCLASDKPMAHVVRGMAMGQKLGVSSTPTLFLNGRKLHVHDLETDLPKEIEQILSATQ